MKRLIVFILCMGFIGIVLAQTTQKFAVCKVIEKKNKVKVEFGENVSCLGTDYEKNVLYFENKRLKFSGGQEAVSYLSDSWGWILCGNPTPLKKGTMWTMKHEVNTNSLNFVRNMRTLEGTKKRYYNRNSDEVYFDYDGSESH